MAAQENLFVTPLPSTYTFAPGVAEELGFYVYMLIDPRNSAVFYVGKGTGHRCFAHVAEARAVPTGAHGDYEKLLRIREIEAAGGAVRIDILRHGLSEREAFLVESAAIDLLPNLTNQVDGHNATEFGRMSVADINAQYGATPIEIDPRHRIVLIRINRNFERGMSDDALYEATRKWWKVSEAKLKAGNPGSPRWAMAVYGGIVRAVYQIESWERPTWEEIDMDPIDSGRWGFRGKRDSEMEATYLHCDVSSYLRAASTGNPSQNPIRYVNCSVNLKTSAVVIKMPHL